MNKKVLCITLLISIFSFATIAIETPNLNCEVYYQEYDKKNYSFGEKQNVPMASEAKTAEEMEHIVVGLSAIASGEANGYIFRVYESVDDEDTKYSVAIQDKKSGFQARNIVKSSDGNVVNVELLRRPSDMAKANIKCVKKER